MHWMDARHCVEALTTADKLEDVHAPCEHGARGIALTRTDHMVFCSAQHIPEMEAKTIAEAPAKMVGKAMPV
ncbi:hypothetical protein PI126_g15101 [Phytophthora idaei]|nr:hypothetical protein PI126_g15101 [Phytophthora idaei]